MKAARTLDRMMDAALLAPPVPRYVEPPRRKAGAALARGEEARRKAPPCERYAPDRTPIINAATPLGTRGAMLLTTRPAPDVTQAVRARQTLAIVVAALLITVFLLLFLARTIVQPCAC
jgi:two-component system sensor histidine kinase ChvG